LFKDHLVWSGLEQEDTRVLYGYLIRHLQIYPVRAIQPTSHGKQRTNLRVHLLRCARRLASLHHHRVKQRHRPLCRPIATLAVDTSLARHRSIALEWELARPRVRAPARQLVLWCYRRFTSVSKRPSTTWSCFRFVLCKLQASSTNI